MKEFFKTKVWPVLKVVLRSKATYQFLFVLLSALGLAKYTDTLWQLQALIESFFGPMM